MSGTVTLRPATPADRPFLERVYAESRDRELDQVPWTPEQKDAFCRSQFAAQDSFYREHYPACEFLVIQEDGRPIGRIYREKRPDELRIVDIALLAEARGGGIGGGLVADVIDEARAAGLAVRINVERDNPARRLYERLGFRIVQSGDVYDLWAWSE